MAHANQKANKITNDMQYTSMKLERTTEEKVQSSCSASFDFVPGKEEKKFETTKLMKTSEWEETTDGR